MLDTFGDYFNEYWNKDYTFFKTNRKDFITSGQELSLDRPNNVLTIPIRIFSLDKLRSIVGVVLSLIFYYSLFKSFIRKVILDLYNKSIDWYINLDYKFSWISENNFNPETGDTFKAFYYSFFIIISVVFY